MGITQEFDKQKILDAITLTLKDSEELLDDLYVKLAQKEKEYKETPFYKKMFSWNYSNLEFFMDQIDDLKYSIRKIKEIQSFLSSSVSETVILDYSAFSLLSSYYRP